jgi:hypothetical protein
MRTTIRLDDHLLAEAKQLAAKTNRTLTSVIEDALREVLARRKGSKRKVVKLPTYGGSGVKPGVDISNSAALLDIMEAPDDPA